MVGGRREGVWAEVVYYLMFPGETNGIGASRDVAVKVDVDSFADVFADQIAAQFQTDSWSICNIFQHMIIGNHFTTNHHHHHQEEIEEGESRGGRGRKKNKQKSGSQFQHNIITISFMGSFRAFQISKRQ